MTVQTYGEWADFFKVEQEGLNGGFFTLKQLFAGLRAETLAGDEAVRVFALLREWPHMGEPLRSEISARLACAEWYCRYMQSLDAAGESCGESFQEFVESLMIGYYRDAGRCDWLFESLHVPVGEDCAESEE